jgi:NADPH:quinone reductase-like Zn-dependent oxidoreductase
MFQLLEEEGVITPKMPRVGSSLVIDAQKFTVVERLKEPTDALKYFLVVDPNGELQVLRATFLNRGKGCWYQRLAEAKERERALA